MSNLTSLPDHMKPRKPGLSTGSLVVGAGLGLMAAAVIFSSARTAAGSRAPAPRHDSAPGRTSRQRQFGEYTVVGRSVTIDRARSDVYAFWRDFGNLARFMENVQSVEAHDDEWLWRIATLGERGFSVRTRIVEDREGDEIAWESVEGSEVETKGKVKFRDAPAERGTVVEAIISYKSPAGALGRVVATIFQKEPSIQARRDLKRLKMLLETGEITTSAIRKST